MGWRWKNKKDLREVVEVERHLRKRNMENLDSRKKNLISVSAYCRPITIIIILVLSCPVVVAVIIIISDLISILSSDHYHHHPRPVLSCRCRCHHHHFRSDPIRSDRWNRNDSTRLDSCQTHTCRHTINIYRYRYPRNTYILDD